VAAASNVQAEAVKVSVVPTHVGVLGHRCMYMSMHVFTSRVLIVGYCLGAIYLLYNNCLQLVFHDFYELQLNHYDIVAK